MPPEDGGPQLPPTVREGSPRHSVARHHEVHDEA
jgi:hypothetical protein